MTTIVSQTNMTTNPLKTVLTAKHVERRKALAFDHAAKFAPGVGLSLFMGEFKWMDENGVVFAVRAYSDDATMFIVEQVSYCGRYTESWGFYNRDGSVSDYDPWSEPVETEVVPKFGYGSPFDFFEPEPEITLPICWCDGTVPTGKGFFRCTRCGRTAVVKGSVN